MQNSASINTGVSCTYFNTDYNYKLKTKSTKVNHNFKHIRQWSNSVKKNGEKSTFIIKNVCSSEDTTEKININR